VVVDDQKELGRRRRGCARVWDGRPDQHVCDPSLVRPLGLEAPEHLRLCLERLALQAPPAQLLSHGALGDVHVVAVPEDEGDLGRRAARELETERGSLLEQLRMGADGPCVRAGLGTEGLEAAGTPGADPAVDRAPRVGAL
jgi:hypothetical protein